MQTRRARWTARILDGLTVALLAAAAALFLDARGGGAQPQAPLPTLERGAPVPAVQVARADGAREALLAAPSVPGHLVLFFRTDCPVCAQQRPAWTELAARARAAGWYVTGVTTERLAPAATGYLGSGLRVVQMDVAAAQRLRTTVVPTTLAARADGTVLLHHHGLLAASGTDSITRAF